MVHLQNLAYEYVDVTGILYDIYIYIYYRAQGLPVALANRNTSLAPVIRDAIAVTLWSSLRAGIADHGNSGLVGGRKSGENVSRPSRSFL